MIFRIDNYFYTQSLPFSIQSQIFRFDCTTSLYVFKVNSNSSLLVCANNFTSFIVQLCIFIQTMYFTLSTFWEQSLQNDITLTNFLLIQDESVLNKLFKVLSSHFSWAIVKHHHLKIIQGTPILIVKLNSITSSYQNGRCRRKTSTILPVLSSQACLRSAHESHNSMTLALLCWFIKQSFNEKRNSNCMGDWAVFKGFVYLYHLLSYLLAYDPQTHDFYGVLGSCKCGFAFFLIKICLSKEHFTYTCQLIFLLKLQVYKKSS